MYGTGPLRIGEPISFSEDLYSLLFVSCYNPALVYFTEQTFDPDENDTKRKRRDFVKQEEPFNKKTAQSIIQL